MTTESLHRTIRYVAGEHVPELQMVDVWYWLAAMYPGQSEKYNAALYLIELKGQDPTAVLDAARRHLHNTNPAKAGSGGFAKLGEGALIGSWFPTLTQLFYWLGKVNDEREKVARECRWVLSESDQALTFSALAEAVGMSERDIAFFAPEWREWLADIQSAQAKVSQTSQAKSAKPAAPAMAQPPAAPKSILDDSPVEWGADESERDERANLPWNEQEPPLTHHPIYPIWDAARKELAVWDQGSRGWFNDANLRLLDVEQGEEGLILVLQGRNEMVLDYVSLRFEALLAILNQHGAGRVTIEDFYLLLYEGVEVA